MSSGTCSAGQKITLKGTNMHNWSFARKIMFPFADRDIPSVLLVWLVYISVKWHDFRLSGYFTLANLFMAFAAVLLLQYLLSKAFRHQRLWVRLAAIAFYLIFLVNFLIVIFSDSIDRWQDLRLGSHLVEGRMVSVSLFLLLALLSFAFRQGSVFHVQNMFMVILFTVVSIGNIIDKPYPFLVGPKIRSKPFEILRQDGNRPVMLIVLDEYQSSAELVRISGDTGYRWIDRRLEQRGWVVRDGLWSLETSTVHSLASLFNFNVSEGGDLSRASDYWVSQNCLFRCSLYDSLVSKNVLVVNKGIVDIGKARPFRRLYFYPRGFWELILRHTLLRTLMTAKPYPYNLDVLREVPEELRKMRSPRNFFYVHLFMPHPPYGFGREFPERSITRENYLDYRSFTDRKLISFVDTLLNIRKDLRIIVTGDHGFRRGGMDSCQVFSAFYGFSRPELDKVRSVQDLGSLVNSCY